MLTGNTVDISMLLRFHWYERVYFRTEDAPFPSTSKETAGYFVGFNDHVGHQLTFAILCDETKRIVYRSEVRSAENPFTINCCADNWGDQDSPEIICSTIDDSIIAEKNQNLWISLMWKILLNVPFLYLVKKRNCNHS